MPLRDAVPRRRAAVAAAAGRRPRRRPGAVLRRAVRQLGSAARQLLGERSASPAAPGRSRRIVLVDVVVFGSRGALTSTRPTSVPCFIKSRFGGDARAGATVIA